MAGILLFLGQGKHKDLLAGRKEKKSPKPIIGLHGNCLQLTSGNLKLSYEFK